MKTSLHNILFWLILLFASVFLPAFACAANSGDIILLFDSSISIRQHRPDIVPELWLQNFLGKIPDDTNLVVVNFDDGIRNITSLRPHEFNSKKATIPAIPLDGLVTDMAAPLQYLADYDGQIALAAIISDGEPEIGDNLRNYFSRTTLENPEYAQINNLYEQKASQGLSKKEIYAQLNSLYAAKNAEIIQDLLASLRNTLGESLIFVDLYGKLPFFKKWATTANGTYVFAPNSEQPIHLEAYVPFSDNKRINKVNTMTEQTPPDQQAPLADSPPPKKQAVPQTPAPKQQAETQAIVAAISQPNSPTEVQVYKADPMSIAIAILITAVVLLLIYFFQQKMRAEKLAALEAQLATQQKELASYIERKKILEHDQASLTATLQKIEKSIAAGEEKKERIEEEGHLLVQKFEAEKISIADNLQIFKQERTAQIEAELKSHSKAKHKALNEELTRIADEFKRDSEAKHKALNEELTQTKKERLSELDREMATLLENRSATIEKEAKAVALKTIEEWERNETLERKTKLENELTLMEQQSLATIQQWEEEADQRALDLLNSHYLEKITVYQAHIRQLNDTQILLKDTVNSRQEESDTLQGKINTQRQLLDKLTATKVEVLVEERRKQEELLWEETTREIQRAKEEALGRIHKREEETKLL